LLTCCNNSSAAFVIATVVVMTETYSMKSRQRKNWSLRHRSASHWSQYIFAVSV